MSCLRQSVGGDTYFEGRGLPLTGNVSRLAGRVEDWYRIDLTQGYEYTVDIWTKDSYPVRHQATGLKILGIHDSGGAMIAGTASAGSGKQTTIMCSGPRAPGRYHIAVGSVGADDSGVYSLRVTTRQIE